MGVGGSSQDRIGDSNAASLLGCFSPAVTYSRSPKPNPTPEIQNLLPISQGEVTLDFPMYPNNPLISPNWGRIVLPEGPPNSPGWSRIFKDYSEDDLFTTSQAQSSKMSKL